MNLLVIFADQQHKQALGRVNPLYKTPNLDQLCDEGVLFENAYSNNPMCGPFRGCLMTGLLTCHNGLTRNNMPLPEGVPTLAGTLRQHGWQTGFVGKWHLGGRGTEDIPAAKRGGFERFNAYQMYNGYDPNEPYNNRVGFFDTNNVEHIYHEHRTEVTTRLAVDMLRDMAKDARPFLLMVGYQAPHYPEQPLPEYAALYDDVTFPIDEEGKNVEPYTPTFNPPSPKEWSDCPDYRRYGGNMQAYKRLYAGMVSQLDHGVGKMMETLAETGKLEDTLIIYTADHGDMQGSHGLKNKGVPYELSAGIPMVVRCPGGRKGARAAQLVQGVDIFATLMDAAGEDNFGDGRSFLPYVQGKDDGERNPFIVSESYVGEDKWRMIRDERFKLVVRMEDGMPLMLFDMQEDPEEKNNLVENADTQALMRKMQSALEETIKA